MPERKHQTDIVAQKVGEYGQPGQEEQLVVVYLGTGYHKPVRLDGRPGLVERPASAGEDRPIETFGATGLTGIADCTEVAGLTGSARATAGIAVAGKSDSGAENIVLADPVPSVAEPAEVLASTEAVAAGGSVGGLVAGKPVAVVACVYLVLSAAEPPELLVSEVTRVTSGSAVVGWLGAYWIGAVRLPPCAERT
ncbi:hypothetical protein N7508_007881 [Penicillium antarcticum]|uniref:uncharacterized protein n=1 Tax=Penicillium antarcticum TaxID=416450 RepID=UPI00238AED63|nr:uncharacterized protein N7508_007881 [Penicillium antarcticum]KAJ5297632.1 hypothetical protein N7508_007881 [Penicillium antarcticum]